MTDTTAFVCKNMGLSGAQVVITQTPNGFEARQAVALFGSYNMPESELERILYNPFHEDFNDNFIVGKGATKEEAIKALEADAKRLTESIWQEF